MAISTLPTPPTRDDPANFNPRADAFLGALPTFAIEVEAARVQIEGISTSTTAARDAAVTAKNDSVTAKDASVAAKDLAVAAAVTAGSAPASPATSTTSMTLGVGNKTLTVQTGKLFGIGQYITAARTSAPVTSRETGILTGYNSGTGVLTYTVSSGAVVGSGTFTDWTVTSANAPTDQTAKLDRINGLSQGGFLTHVDLGTITSGATATLNVLAAEMFRVQAPASGSMTIAISNVPNTAGTGGLRMLEFVNPGGKTLTWPTGNWIKADGTEVATPALAGVTFLASGTNRIFFWFAGSNTLKFKAM